MTRPPPDAVLLHDFNNLLTAIAGVADAVLERPNLDPESRADIVSIRDGALRGTALGLNPRQNEPDPPDQVAVNGTIRAAARLLARRLGRGVTLTLALAEPDSLVRIEAAALDRVLLNLIANARHAMSDGGTVTLSAGPRLVTAGETHVPDTIPPGGYVVIGVADTGQGVPPENLTRIFDPGFTTRCESGGSGLGLASVHQVVLAHGGFVSVRSSEGQGTCIDLYLPYAGSAPAEAIAVRTVLLVDDDDLVRGVAERMLLRAGWRVLAADSARCAREILEGSDCDLMISDVAMPEMDGIALTRWVLARRADLPVILTSGYAAKGDLPPGHVSFLAKPYGRDDLLTAVAQALR